MSTKTSFKRIALVAASALAIAGLSAVPAHAVDIAFTGAGNGLTVTTPTATTTPNVAVGSTFSVGTTEVTAADVVTYTATLVAPANSALFGATTTAAAAGLAATNIFRWNTTPTTSTPAGWALTGTTTRIDTNALGTGALSGVRGAITIMPDVV